jgi:hypothetical protein
VFYNENKFDVGKTAERKKKKKEKRGEKVVLWVIFYFSLSVSDV